MLLSQCDSKAGRVDRRPWRPLRLENFITMLKQAATDDDTVRRGRMMSRGSLPLCLRCGGCATNRSRDDDDDENGNNDATIYDI